MAKLKPVKDRATSKRMLDYCKEDARLSLVTRRLEPIDTEGVEIAEVAALHAKKSKPNG